MRWPVAVWTALTATTTVPPSTCGATASGSTPPLRNGTWRTSYPFAASMRHGKWLELYSRSPITTFSPGAAGPNCAAIIPAAVDTDGTSATSAGAAPMILATAARERSAAASPRA